ncbi:MAG: hypothetical protein FJY42_08860, partial [Betaproteobacteria bacterium]|nr:hypothetical protein [Betaproteobacteria bacterium]
MRRIDELHLEHPFMGARMLRRVLARQGIFVGRRHLGGIKEKDMPRKKTSPERIISLLRQIEVQMASGVTLPQACKQAQISTQSYYRWRQEFGGLQVD